MRQRLALTVLVVVLVWATTATGAQTLDRIIAVVNDDVILASELRQELREVRQRLSGRDMPMPPADELRRRVLERLVMRRLQLGRADRMGITVDQATLDASVRRVAQQNGMSLSEFRDALQSQGMNMAGMRDRLRRDITLQRVRQAAMQRRVNVTPQEVDQFLAQNTGDDMEYRLGHILISAPEGASPEQLDEARQRAEELRTRLDEGANFDTLAATWSDSRTALDGGDVGWRSGGELPQPLMNQLQGMSPGAVTEVIRTPSGFHLFKLKDRRQAERQIVTQVRARHILIRQDEVVSAADARRRLASLRQRIVSGDAAFEELARANSADTGSASRGGNLGWVQPDSMVPSFAEELRKLEAGELSEPFRSRYGWHLVELLDRREKDNTEETRRRRATSQIRQRKQEQEMELWMRELRDEAYVDYRLEQ